MARARAEAITQPVVPPDRRGGTADPRRPDARGSPAAARGVVARILTGPHDHWPARCQSTRSSPADAIRHWSAEGGHPIEDLTRARACAAASAVTAGRRSQAFLGPMLRAGVRRCTRDETDEPDCWARIGARGTRGLGFQRPIIRSWRPFCCGDAGAISSGRIPSRIWTGARAR